MRQFAVDPGFTDLDVGDGVRVDGERVGAEDHEIGALSGGDAAQFGFPSEARAPFSVCAVRAWAAVSRNAFEPS